MITSFFTDLHLGVHQNSDKWLQVAEDWCDWYCTNLQKFNVHTVIFAGDLFHHRDEVSNKTLDVASRLIDKIADNCTQLIMIPGNHDCYYKDSAKIHYLTAYNRRSNIIVYDKPTMLTHEGTKILFCPWGTNAEDIQPADLIVGHFDIVGFKMNNYKLCEHGFDANILANNSKYTVTGHYHTRSIKRVKNSIIHYIGNPFEMDRNDLGDKKVQYIFDIKDGKITPTAAIENTLSPRHKDIKLEEAVQDPSILKNVIAKIVIPEMDYKDMDKALSTIRSVGAFDLQTEFTNNKLQLEEELKVVQSETMYDSIKSYVDQLSADDPTKKKLTTYLQDIYTKCSV